MATTGEGEVMAFFTSFAAGLAGWTLLEYAIHYWLGHLPRGRILISSEHLRHHADILYFTPLRLKIRGAIPVLAVVFLAVGAGFGLAAGLGFVAAVSVGWTTYECLHQSIHINGPRSAYSRWAARYHLSHHFGRAQANFGVTSPLWDLIFRTYVPVQRVRVPQRFLASVPWLALADGGKTDRPDIAVDYELA